MAMRLFRVVVVSLAVLALGSCNVLQYIFGSVFPSTMALIKAQVDLSKLIPASNNGSTYLRLVETGGYGYVVVTGSPASNQYFAYFYDLDLNLKKPVIGANAFGGTGVMVDANNLIAVGKELLNPADLSLASTNPTIVNASGNSGVDGVVANAQNVDGIYCPNGSNTFSYTVNTGSWAAVTTPPPVYPVTFTPTLSVSPNSSSYQVNAVLDDGNSAGNMILVISQGSNGNNGNNGVTGYFITIPKSSMNPSTALPNNLLDAAPHRDNLDGNSFGYANGSIFAYDTKTSSYVRINPADGSIKNSFSSASNNNQQPQFAYRISGGSFYSFDTNTRILTKYTAWW